MRISEHWKRSATDMLSAAFKHQSWRNQTLQRTGTRAAEG